MAVVTAVVTAGATATDAAGAPQRAAAGKRLPALMSRPRSHERTVDRPLTVRSANPAQKRNRKKQKNQRAIIQKVKNPIDRFAFRPKAIPSMG
jgi:hypothetical protein